MTTELLSRMQFSLTIMFHYIFPIITIGMAWLLVLMQALHAKTKDDLYERMFQFWLKIFAITFVMGVATGITMEFQFGMNWADYSRFVGDIFGAPLAAEGIFAFFLESTFLGVLLFGKNKVSLRVYSLSTWMVALGSTLSAFWIIVANSWQQTPAGYVVQNGRAELVDFWAAIFNPSTIPRFLHTVDGALIGGAFFVAGLSAWMILKNVHTDIAKGSLRIALLVGFVASFLALPLGHFHAVQVANTQPAKLAAFEGLWETGPNAPLLIFGIPNAEAERTDFAIKLPSLLSIGVGGSPDTEVIGLKAFPKEERPPLLIPFFSFHVMVGLGMLFMGFTSLGMFLWWKKQLFDHKWFLWAAFLLTPLPIIANELGWVAAEVGRQPWIVQGLLKTSEGFSQVISSGQIIFSMLVFGLLYAFLFFVWLFLLRKNLLSGLTSEKEVQP